MTSNSGSPLAQLRSTNLDSGGTSLSRAIKLHQNIRSSFRQYKVTKDRDFTPFVTTLLSEDIDAEQDMKNIATWGTETACTNVTFLHYLYPGIIRLGLDNEEDMWLVRPVYVFSKHRPTGRAAESFKPPRSRTEGSAHKRPMSQAIMAGLGFGSQRHKSEEPRQATRHSVSHPLGRNPSEASSGTLRSHSGMDVEPSKGFKEAAEGGKSPHSKSLIPPRHLAVVSQGLRVELTDQSLGQLQRSRNAIYDITTASTEIQIHSMNQETREAGGGSETCIDG